MSIKIYEGYKTNLSLKAIRTHCLSLNQEVKEIKKVQIKRHVNDSKIAKDWEGYKKDIDYVVYDLGVNIDITLFPISDYFLVKIYMGRIFHTSKILEKIIDKLNLVFYGYWNNVDEDDTCSREEWEQRKEDWTEALGLDDDENSGRACNNGFTISLSTNSAIDY
jgi:hypothetical protein